MCATPQLHRLAHCRHIADGGRLLSACALTIAQMWVSGCVCSGQPTEAVASSPLPVWRQVIEQHHTSWPDSSAAIAHTDIVDLPVAELPAVRDGLVEYIAAGRDYSAAIAAALLLAITEVHPELLDDDTLAVVGDLITLHPPTAFTPDRVRTSVSVPGDFVNWTYPEATIDLHCGIRAGGGYVVLRDELPHGWGVTRIDRYVNGELFDEYPIPDGQRSYHSYVSLRPFREILSRVGHYVVEYRITIESPNGTAVTKTFTIEVDAVVRAYQSAAF